MSFMQKFNLSLGQWFGVQLRLHWSWILMLILLIAYSPILAIAFVGMFVLVVLHEYGHCFAAHYYRIPISEIMLYPFGGAAMMRMTDCPRTELVIAVAGPAVNILLIPVMMLISDLHQITLFLMYCNYVLLIFNLLPAFPMDGGRVLRACLALCLKDYCRATVIAGRIGQVFGGLFIGFGLFSISPMLALVGIFVISQAEQEIAIARANKANGTSFMDNVLESERMLFRARRTSRREDQS